MNSDNGSSVTLREWALLVAVWAYALANWGAACYAIAKLL
jgi:hypothetical protein